MKSILQEDDGLCYYCQGYGSERYHIIGGAHSNKVYCEEDGLVIRVCRRCNNKLHSSATLSGALRKKAQEKWEAHSTAEKPRDEWMKRYGRSWL